MDGIGSSLTAPQQRLDTMRTLDTFHCFVAGKFEHLAEVPEWLRDAVIADRECDDWNQALSEQGAEIIESYGVPFYPPVS